MLQTNPSITRRDLLRASALGTGVAIAGSAVPAFATDGRPENVQVAEIYQLQAAFHRAKTTQDIDLMMSLWAERGTFTNQSTGTTFSGFDEIKSFWQGSGSYTHHRFSLVPSYKTKIDVHGDEAFLYFECHDVGNFVSGSFGDPAVKTIVNDTFLAGTVRNVDGNWVFWKMTAGPSSPLSFDHYYFP